MDIQGYIIDHWFKRMTAEHPVLTIYDAEGRFAELLPLAEQRGAKVIDTTHDFLNARLTALQLWRSSQCSRLIIYRKRKRPESNREEIEEPYSCFTVGGTIFPDGPKDNYQYLCESCLPNKHKEIKELFNAGTTSFSTINALFDGANYPELEQFTRGKSMPEITVGLLAQTNCANMSWAAEWQRFANAHLPGLSADGATLAEIQNKLWAYLLFSEFVFDLPQQLPASLQSVPMANPNAKENIYLICDNLRGRVNLRDTYVRMANKTAQNLHLNDHFATAKNLGERVTFAFENNVEYARFIECLKKSDLQLANDLLSKNQKDVWYEVDRNVEAFWDLAKHALSLFKCASQGIEYDNTLKGLIAWYDVKGYKADEAFRSFHTDLQSDFSITPFISELTDLMNSCYRDFCERTVKAYQSHIKEITQLPDMKNQGCVQSVYPALAEGKKVVIAFVDAFRYEMGKGFANQIEGQFKDKINCKPAVSVFPSITRFGMAAHLGDISMSVEDGVLQPVIDGKVVRTPDDRIAYLRNHTGVEVQDFPLKEFNVTKINDSTKLLVIRSWAIDNVGENNSNIFAGLPTMKTELVQLKRAIDDCRTKGFDLMVIVADHGFMLQPSFRVGDLVPKPVGSNIVLEESRLIAGSLNESPDTLSFSPNELGTVAPVMKFCYAKNFTTFTKGDVYFHEGLSLQENVVPQITIQLQDEKEKLECKVELKYKDADSGTIYTRRPIIDINIVSNELLFDAIHFVMQITDEQGNIIGKPDSKLYNELTEQIDIPSGAEKLRQPVAINDDYNGNIVIVRALDPATNLTLSELKLNFENEL